MMSTESQHPRTDWWTVVGLAVATAATALAVGFGYRFLVVVPRYASAVVNAETFSDIEAAWVGSLVFLLGGMIPFTITLLVVRRRQPATFLGRVGTAAVGHLVAAVPSVIFIALSSGIAVALGVTATLAGTGFLLYLAVLSWRPSTHLASNTPRPY